MAVVYSTSGPADGSETAKAIRKALRKCPHGSDTEPVDTDRLDLLGDEEIERRIEHLLSTVDGLDRRAQAAVAVEDAIDRDDLPALEEHHQRLIAGDNDAQVAWAQLERPLEPWPPQVAREELLTDSLRLITAVEDPQLAERLQESIDKRCT